MTHSSLAGYLYPSNFCSRCPRFHACRLTQKCQNYNPHLMECETCESRVSPNPQLAGLLPEGEYAPDLQHGIKELEDRMNVAFSHPDGKRQRLGPDITLEFEKSRRATEQLAEFLSESKAKFEEKITHALTDSAMRKYLGKLN